MITPVFRIFDYQQAYDFYIGWLGFRIDWENRPSNGPVYLQISRGDIVLHLVGGPSTEVGSGSRVRAVINGLMAYHHFLLKKDSSFTAPGLVKAEWDARVMEAEVIDPFGNHIVFAEACG